MSNASGRSPRGRGRQGCASGHRGRRRSIPAWAGETLSWGRLPTMTAVDPRVGGGDQPLVSATGSGEGRSPRGRGRQGGHAHRLVAIRSIPAWAGETAPTASGGPLWRVDPRVGGGDFAPSARRIAVMGRSPRGRGRPRWSHRGPKAGGSIPAWAGETTGWGQPSGGPRVDPRVGGGDGATSTASAGVWGRSPRGRGRHVENMPKSQRHRSIPAWAGETRRLHLPLALLQVDPRVGGGDGFYAEAAAEPYGRSPRGRGRPPHGLRCDWPPRSIPAWAGETAVTSTA